ncbi:hypothetical protein [Marinitoga sp. 1154]|uniref:hypothetical protein n=1 Tax=Marinitoga sp. 1154 TaxID=1643335 RepID=UPI001586DC25|nr:hypothetical protein [Marinitoga sp. 1154]
MSFKTARYMIAIGMILVFIENLSLAGLIIQFIGIYIISERLNDKKLFYYFVISLFLFYTVINFFVPQTIISIFKSGDNDSFYSLKSMEYYIYTGIKDHMSIISLSFFSYIISLFFERIAYKSLYKRTLNKEFLFVLKLIVIKLIILIFSYILFAKWVLDGIGFITSIALIIIIVNSVLILILKIFEIIGFLNINYIEKEGIE